MPIFRVYAKTFGQCYIDIDAPNADEANDIARSMDGGDWENDPSGDDWEQIDGATHEITKQTK